jgi:hypothetical protein
MRFRFRLFNKLRLRFLRFRFHNIATDISFFFSFLQGQEIEPTDKVPAALAKPSEKADDAASSRPPQREAPRGIFANIDFDALNRRTARRKTPPPLVKEKVATTQPKSVLDQSVRTLLGIKNPR